MVQQSNHVVQFYAWKHTLTYRLELFSFSKLNILKGTYVW